MVFFHFFLFGICVGLKNEEKCEKLRSSYCKINSQNETSFPNKNSNFNGRQLLTQDDVDNYFQNPGSIITTLLEHNCHGELHYFACMYHFPVCNEQIGVVFPCRELCLDIKQSCMRSDIQSVL